MRLNPKKNYDYAALKKSACNAIDDAAERERLQYSTSGSTMASIYQYKLEEATKFMALSEDDKNNATQSEFPFLYAELSSSGNTLNAAAETILAANAIWKNHMARIEGGRRNTKTAIMMSPDDKSVIDQLVRTVNFNVQVFYE